MNLDDHHVFFDDGGVMNDNNKRGPQWQRLVGEYFSEKFGGKPSDWGKANHQYILGYLKEYGTWTGIYKGSDYDSFNRLYIKGWVEGMFNLTGTPLPPVSEYAEIFYSASAYVTPRVRADFPEVIDTISELYSEGYNLHTASGESSADLHGYLSGMGVRDMFTNLYGPDLVNTIKNGELYYREIFKAMNITPEQAIVIDDDPIMLQTLTKIGAHVIQSCLTREHQPFIHDYIEEMSELPPILHRIVTGSNQDSSG